MAPAKPAAGQGPVADFVAGLNPPTREEVALIREIILGVDPAISEEIKWKVPSFRTTEHFATLNLRTKAGVRIVFHLGAKVRHPEPALQIDDPAGLLEWLSPVRALATLPDLARITAHRTALEEIVRAWITQV